MEVKISIRTRGFAVDVDQKFSVIARSEGVKKGADNNSCPLPRQYHILLKKH